MTKLGNWGWLALTLLFGCKSQADAARAEPAPAPAAAPSAVPPSSGAQAALDKIDSRTPVPLLPMMAHHQKENMRDHLIAVQQIVAAVATKDFPAVEKAAARIGFSETMGKMCSHMGAGAPGFTETALKFHHDADKIGEAARKKDAQLVLSALGETLSQCTSCHATFKQSVVGEDEWSQAAGGAAPPRHHVN